MEPSNANCIKKGYGMKFGEFSPMWSAFCRHSPLQYENYAIVKRGATLPSFSF